MQTKDYEQLAKVSSLEELLKTAIDQLDTVVVEAMNQAENNNYLGMAAAVGKTKERCDEVKKIAEALLK